MKKLAVLILCLAMLGCMNGLADHLYTPGTYEASVQGMGGPVVVTMEFSENAIVSVSAVGELETKGLGDDAIETLTHAVLEAQSAEVDMISGATVSSTAMLAAAADCINQAMGIASAKPVVTEETADVIVIGAGAAGLSAAAGAVENGASVIVLEANSFLGGAAGTSMGNILDFNQDFAQAERNDAALEKYAGYGEDRFPEPWKTDYKTLLGQIEEYKNNGQEKGSLVTIERVMVDHYVKGMGQDREGNTVSLDYDLIRSGVENAKNVYTWLEEYGLTTTPLMEYVSTPAGRGMGLIELLEKAADGAEIRLNTRARELVVENGRVVGVIAEDGEGNSVTYHANAGVILATGSFSSNGEMVAKYQKIGTGLTANIPSNNPAGNRGDGIVMAEAIGAELRDMGFIQTYLKGYQNLAASGEAGNAFKAAQLVVNTNAVRFADDSNQSRIVSREGNDQPDGILIAVGDNKMIEALNAQKDGFADELISRGMAYTADSLDELAGLLGLDGATLTATVDTFNGYVDAEEDAEFGRKTFNGKVENGPFYAAKLQLACHLTFGGLVINGDAQVLNTEGAPIPGLYAAGDVTSGYEGVVHQTGNCLSIIINTGRKAGANAAALPAEKTALTDGEYTATVNGRNAPLTLSVTVKDNAIVSVVLGDHEETPGVADSAIVTLPEEIVKYQSIGVDTVTGATVTSEAILAAVADCIGQAGGNAREWKTQVVKTAGEDIELTADVIVIGAGGAGMTAAATAGEKGASVIVIDKAAAVGGNTILCGGAYNAADPEVQKLDTASESQKKELASYLEMDETDFGAFGETLTILKQQIRDYLATGEDYLFDSVELHMIQSYTGSKRVAMDGSVIEPDYELIYTLCHNALDGWHWLESIGVPTKDTLTTAVGALWKRTHEVQVPATGAKPLTDALEAYDEAQGVQIILGTTATDFIVVDGVVTGVMAHQNDGTRVILHANHGVVLATGGFAGNVEMCVEYNNYWPDLTTSAKTDNTATAKGDGIRMAKAIGANTVGMGFIQMLPTCTALDGQAGKGVGSQIYVNKEGKRYVNENNERDLLCKAALAQTDGIFYGVGDASMIAKQGEAKIRESESKGYVFVGDTLEEVAAKAGVDATALTETVTAFNGYVDAQEDPDFGRYAFIGKIETAPFVIAPMSPALHHTMGGVEINSLTQVISETGAPIPGLYAAGEVCGGIHAGNRLGGNAVADAVVYGRIAGEQAAAFVK